MSIQAITTKVVSTLGNKESLIPIMIKDGVDSSSLTYKSFKEGGPIEGMDRAIDEFGTQAIWIGGIPFYKKLIDFTAYKIGKINPQVDPRIIANKEYATWAKENAKGIMTNTESQTVQSAIKDCLKDGGKLAKNLYKGKIIAATALTLATFFLLTKTKQKRTKDTVLDEMKSIKDHEIEEKEEKNIFSEFNEYQSMKNPAFKGIGKNLSEAIMFNPVHNMKIIDAGITTERLACSRNKTEFFEHAIKEGGFLFFIYGFGNLIEKGINKAADKFFHKPIDLKIDVLMDNKLSDALLNGKIAKDVAQLPAKNKTLTEKLNFLINNPDNILVQAAKKSKFIQTLKDSNGVNVIDTSKYIYMNEIESLAEQLLNIDKNFQSAKEPVNKFLAKTKALKVSSVMANIGISCLVLGYVIPKLIYKYREMKTGTTKFHVVEDIKNKNKKDIQ